MPRKRKGGGKSGKKLSLILSISCTRVKVEVNPVVYSEDEIKEIHEIIDHMMDHVYIDKTYVAFEGTRWNDAFIVEDTWHKFCKLIVDTHFGRDAGEKINDYILTCLKMLTEQYLYRILDGYGYDPALIEITFPPGCEFSADYEVDERESWDS